MRLRTTLMFLSLCFHKSKFCITKPTIQKILLTKITVLKTIS